MKKIIVMLIALFFVTTGAFGKNWTEGEKAMDKDNTEKILFINGSARKDGNTAHLAESLLKGYEYETLTLPEYRINVYGQTLSDDQFDIVIGKIKQADVVVIGSPVYWLTICASIRTLMERFHGPLTRHLSRARSFSSFSKEAVRPRRCLNRETQR